MSSPSQTPDQLDLDVVAHQLGRPAAHHVHPLARVAVRCRWRLPAVVECFPYDADGKPFPTLFYLTCPTAAAAVGHVESAGWSRRCADLLAASPEMRRSLAAARAYERRRRRRLAAGPAAAGAARAVDGGAVLRGGIGGTSASPCLARPTSSSRAAAAGGLKCLHAHAAHALARPRYGFGAAVLEQARAAAGSLWCDDARCAHQGSAPSAGAVPCDSLPVAIVDLGTNTCRLLLGRVGPQWCGPVSHEARITTVVRLGQGVDDRGRLATAAMTRTLDCLTGYAESIDRFAPAARRVVATSALRDAADGADFLSAVERQLGLPWRILSGGEEAAATFRGAVCGAAGRAAAAALAAATTGSRSLLVVDIGGGSTELIAGRGAAPTLSAVAPAAAGADTPPPAPDFSCSVDVGAVRLTERCFRHDPPTPAEWGAAVRRTRAMLRTAVPPHARTQVGAAVGVAGTISTLVANKLGMREYRSELVDGQPLHLWEIGQAIARFRVLTSAERARLPGIQPGREDVILAGALIAQEVCLLFGLPGVRCGESDILEGAALQLADDARQSERESTPD